MEKTDAKFSCCLIETTTARKKYITPKRVINPGMTKQCKFKCQCLFIFLLRVASGL